MDFCVTFQEEGDYSNGWYKNFTEREGVSEMLKNFLDKLQEIYYHYHCLLDKGNVPL